MQVQDKFQEVAFRWKCVKTLLGSEMRSGKFGFQKWHLYSQLDVFRGVGKSLTG